MSAAVLVAAVALAALGWGYWRWQRVPVSEPPSVTLAGVDSEVARAVETARQAVRDDPRSAAAWGHFAMVLHAHEFMAKASVCYAQAEQLDAADPRWPYLLGLVKLKGSPDPRAGLDCLGRAVECGGPVQSPRLLLGEALLEEGRLGEAEGHFRRVLEADDDNARAHLGLGRVAFARNDLKESLDHLTRSADLASRVKATHVLLAEVHHRLGDEPAADAERRLLPELRDDPGWPDPYLDEVSQCWVGVVPSIQQATNLLHQGRGPEALELLQQTIRAHPDALLAYLALGRFSNRLGRHEEAEAVLREAVRRVPDAFEAQFELGIALEHQARNQEAGLCYRRATVLKPDYAPAHHHLGLCLLEEDDGKGALASFRAAVRYKPDFAEAHKALGSLLLERGEAAQALSHLQWAVRLNPEDRDSRMLLEQAQKRRPSPGHR
ncbi:MAG TPA: tetratricopeptide repeat protein [Gemmataceae bacterium]|nr:tetratricopeptide repeat protein [Gemmataceae bacterium]